MPRERDSPSTADRALLQAFRAWGGREVARSWDRFSPSWRDRLLQTWPAMLKATPEAAWAELRRDHVASARPDPSRVHPSWFVRALRTETTSVQRSVAAHAPLSLREPLRRGLGLEPTELIADRPPDPDALRWALALWAERIVGDVPARDEDPPVIVAMTRLGTRDIARLVKVCGLVKHAFAIEGHGPSVFAETLVRFTPIDRVRLGFFRRSIGEADRRLVPLARLDLQTIQGDWRRGHLRLGLVTLGRLLTAAEPHRARWASQHLPYPIAQLLRIKPTTALPPRPLLTWEAWVLEAAWARLLSEGRLTGGRGVWP